MPHVEDSWVVLLQIRQRIRRCGAESVNVQAGGANEALLHGGQDKFLQFIIEAVRVENGDGRVMACLLYTSDAADEL